MILLTAGILSVVAAQSGPVGWWRGDDGAAPTTALDSSGNGRDGAYTSGATTSTATFPPGLFNNDSVFQLDGTNDQVTVPHNTAFNLTGDITIAFWMRKTAEATDYQRLVGKGASNVRTFGVWEDAGAGQRILFQQYNGSGGSVLDLWTTNNAAGTVPLNTWKHVACTIEGTAVTIYLDAVSNVTGTRTVAPGTDSQPVRLGHGEIHTYFPGQLDEVRLFNRALVLSEIQMLAGLTASAVPAQPTFSNTTPSGTTLNWTTTTGANSYVVQRSTAGGPFVTIATGITGLSYTDSGLTSGTNYAYVVYAVGLVNSADSTPNSVVIPFPPPRTNDHSEGLLDENCSCGSTAPGTSIPWAVLAALVLVALRKR